MNISRNFHQFLFVLSISTSLFYTNLSFNPSITEFIPRLSDQSHKSFPFLSMNARCGNPFETVGTTYSDGERFVETNHTERGWTYTNINVDSPQCYAIYQIYSHDAHGTGDNKHDFHTHNNISHYATAGEISQEYDRLIDKSQGESKQRLVYEKNLWLSKYPHSPLYTSVKFNLSANATWDGLGFRKARGYIKVAYTISYVRVLTKNELSQLINYRSRTL